MGGLCAFDCETFMGQNEIEHMVLIAQGFEQELVES